MAKKQAYLINGEIKYLTESAGKMAIRFYGATLIKEKELNMPDEVKAIIMKPKILVTEPIVKTPEISKPELKKPPEVVIEEPIVKEPIIKEPVKTVKQPTVRKRKTKSNERNKIKEDE